MSRTKTVKTNTLLLFNFELEMDKRLVVTNYTPETETEQEKNSKWQKMKNTHSALFRIG